MMNLASVFLLLNSANLIYRTCICKGNPMSSSTSLNSKASVMFTKLCANEPAVGVLFGKLSKHIMSNHKL